MSLRTFIVLAAFAASLGLPAAHAFEDLPAVEPGGVGPHAKPRRHPLPEVFAAVAAPGWEDGQPAVPAATRELIAAARAGKVDAVRALLNAGALANGADEAGDRPLLAAAGEGHVEVVRLLLQRGADPNAKGPRGRNPLGLAAAEGHAGIVALLLKAGALTAVRSANGNCPIHEAARLNRVAVLRELLKADPDVFRLPDRQGLQPLAVAARAGNIDAMQLLLAAGAGVDDPDRKGQTALYWAIYDHQDEAEVFLLKHGAAYSRLVIPAAGG